MADVKNLIVKISADASGLNKGMAAATSSFDKFKAAAGIAFAAVGAAFAALATKSVIAFAAAEQAQLGLSSAIKNFGGDVNAVLPKLQQLNDVLQATTTLDADLIAASQQQGLAMGIQASEMENATRVAAGLAGAYRIDMTTAMQLVAKAQQGIFTGFRSYSPEVVKAASDTEKLDIINRTAAAGLGNLRDELNTTAGKYKFFQTQVEEVYEAIGEGIIKGVAAIANFQGSFADMAAVVQKLKAPIIQTFVGIGQIVGGVFSALVSNIRILADAFVIVGMVIGKIAGGIGKVCVTIAENYVRFVQFMLNKAQGLLSKLAAASPQIANTLGINDLRVAIGAAQVAINSNVRPIMTSIDNFWNVVSGGDIGGRLSSLAANANGVVESYQRIGQGAADALVGATDIGAALAGDTNLTDRQRAGISAGRVTLSGTSPAAAGGSLAAASANDSAERARNAARLRAFKEMEERAARMRERILSAQNAAMEAASGIMRQNTDQNMTEIDRIKAKYAEMIATLRTALKQELTPAQREYINGVMDATRQASESALKGLGEATDKYIERAKVQFYEVGKNAYATLAELQANTEAGKQAAADAQIALETWGTTAQQMAANINSSIQSSMSNGIMQSIEAWRDGTKTIGEVWNDAMSNIGRTIVNEIVSAATTAVLRASGITQGVNAIFGGGGGKNGGSGIIQSGLSALGGFLGFAEGGIVTGGIPGRDSVPALLTPGEMVLTRGQQAGLAGSQTSITINAVDASSFMAMCAKNPEAIVSQVQRFIQLGGNIGLART